MNVITLIFRKGWWVSRQGEKMNYWGGAAIDRGQCACGMTNSCEKNNMCNCDAVFKELREDNGYLWWPRAAIQYFVKIMIRNIQIETNIK